MVLALLFSMHHAGICLLHAVTCVPLGTGLPRGSASSSAPGWAMVTQWLSSIFHPVHVVYEALYDVVSNVQVCQQKH